MKRNIYGYELIMDLYGCDKSVITSAKKIREYVHKLCKLIDMKRFGKTLVPHFGDNAAYTKGFSMMQFIETSSITGHFSDLWLTAYINIFSCKTYDQIKAKNFTKKFFKAKGMKARFIVR